MAKKIGFKKIETNVPNDVTIFKIGDIEVNDDSKRTKATIDALLNDLKVYNLDGNITAVLSLTDDSGKISGILVGNEQSKINNLLETLVIGKRFHISGVICFLDKTTLKEFDNEFKKQDFPFIKDIVGNMFLVIRAIEVI